MSLKRPAQLRLWPTLGALLGLAILLSLGTWQHSRYHQKLRLEAARAASVELPALQIDDLTQLDPQEHAFRRLRVRGQLMPAWTVLFKHRQHEKHPGYWVAQPLRLQDTDQVLLLNRGWLPRERALEVAADMAKAPAPAAQLYEGLLHVPEQIIADTRTRDLLARAQVALEGGLVQWSTYDLEAIYAALPLRAATPPMILVLDPKHSGDPLPIASLSYLTAPYMTSDRHMSYFIFWYAMATVLLLFYLAYTFGLLRSPSPRSPHDT